MNTIARMSAAILHVTPLAKQQQPPPLQELDAVAEWHHVPFSWEQIQQCITYNQPFRRTARVQSAYDQNKERVRQVYASYADFIKITCLEYTPFMDFASSPHACRKLKAIGDAGKLHAFVKNTYPYDIHPSIAHYNVWAHAPLSFDQVHAIVRRTFPSEPFLVLLNPPERMSVPDVWHCHVFIQLPKTGSLRPHVLL